MSYGITPTGYVRKPLAVILAELEASLVTEFGPGVIQTAQSPLGQLNGLMADHIAELWELGEDLYQSIDPDQAEGARLDVLARLRLLERASADTDESFRRAITNQSTARINLADLLRGVRGVPDVTYSRVFVNETSADDGNGMPPNTVAVAALGGDDALLAEAMNLYVIPGVSTFGNQALTVIEEGYCRTLRIIRPVEIATQVTVVVRTMPDALGCPPPSSNAIRAALLSYLNNSTTRPGNGQAITPHYVRTYLEGLFPNVEVLEVTGLKGGVPETEPGGIFYAFTEIAKVELVTVVVA